MSEFSDQVADELTEIWLRRYPRIDERGLRDRVLQALAGVIGFGPGERQHGPSDDELDDAEVIVEALREHVFVLKRIKAGIASGEISAAIDAATKGIGDA